MRPTETISRRMSRLLKEEQGYKEKQVPTCGEEKEDIYGDQWSSPSHAPPHEVSRGLGTCTSGAPESHLLSLLPRLVGLLNGSSAKSRLLLHYVHKGWPRGSVCRVCTAPGIWNIRLGIEAHKLKLTEDYAGGLLSLNFWH